MLWWEWFIILALVLVVVALWFVLVPWWGAILIAYAAVGLSFWLDDRKNRG